MTLLRWFHVLLKVLLALTAGLAAAVGAFFMTVAFLGLFTSSTPEHPPMPSEAELDKLIDNP